MQHCKVLGSCKALGPPQTCDNFPVLKRQLKKTFWSDLRTIYIGQSGEREIDKEDDSQETLLSIYWLPLDYECVSTRFSMSSQSVLVGFGLWATERTLSRFLFPIRMRIRFWIWRVLSIALRQCGTAVTGFARRVLGYIDLDLCNDLLHHICRHIWPNWRSRWSGQYLQVWHWKMQMLGTSNEMAVSSWLNLPLQLQLQSISNHSVIITAIVTISTTNCSSDLDSLQFQLTCEIPRIRVKAQYRSTGVLILVKASGAGDYWGEYGK